jgi:hypothetical protein
MCSTVKGETAMTPRRQPDWYYLAEQASNESDPEKLMSLIGELNRALDEHQRTRQRPQTQESI